jgi:hypothetical protein
MGLSHGGREGGKVGENDAENVSNKSGWRPKTGQG